jgi:hypothetical protein
MLSVLKTSELCVCIKVCRNIKYDRLHFAGLFRMESGACNTKGEEVDICYFLLPCILI